MINILKKIGIISAIIVGICVIGLIIIIIFFPGLDVYLYAKKNCPHMDDKIEEYDYYDTVVPDDFVQVKAGDLYVSGPKESVIYNPGTGDFYNLFKNSEEHFWINYTSFPNQNIYFEVNDYVKYNQEDHLHFFKSIGYDMPATDRDMNVFRRDVLDLKMSLHLRGKDKKIYKEMADAMEEASKEEKLYRFEHNNVEGYICEILPDKKNRETYWWNADIYVGEGGNMRNIIGVSSPDLETIKQVIASIKPAE